MNSQIRFGIEEEYFITDLQTRCMAGQPPAQAVEQCRTALGDFFAYEMFQGQIEVASPIFTGLAQAADYLTDARGELRSALKPFGLGLLSAGSHPLADWRAQQATVLPHFNQLFEDFQLVARRSLWSGLHVHVEVPAAVDRIQVMNEILPWTPLLLALSCSSPFAEGADSGFMSYRQTACDEWPRMGIPEYLEDEQAHKTYVEWLMGNGSIRQASECWWGVRPATRYPTLELRMTDACPRLEHSLCIAALFRLLVACAIEQANPGASYSPTSRRVAQENRWRAKRSGVRGAFIVEGFDRTFSAEQWLFRAEQLYGDAAQQLLMPDVFTQARRILEQGTSAERQRVVYTQALHQGADANAALAAVVDHLLAEASL